MFLAIVLGAALQAACSASTNLSYVRGERWTVNVSECDLKELPRWSEADEAPPLSPRKAIQAARTLLRTLVADADSWRLDAVRLKPLGQEWIYVVEFYEPSPVPARPIVGPVPPLNIVVLMNGVAPIPMRSPWPMK